jgi:hypothetical protein
VENVILPGFSQVQLMKMSTMDAEIRVYINEDKGEPIPLFFLVKV